MRGIIWASINGKVKEMSGKKILGEVNKELANEWHPTKNGSLTPFDITTGSGKKVWWKCLNGHEWQAPVYSRVNGNGCSECFKTGNRTKKLAYKRSLAFKNPILSSEWAYEKNQSLTPSDIGENSRKIVWWKCKNGHEWRATVASRTRSFKLGLGCPYCEKRILSEEHSLAVTYPNLSTEWHPTKNAELTPNDLTPYSHKSVWWKCEKGHEWQAKISNRSAHGRGCPYCSHTLVTVENCLATVNPLLAKEWHLTRNGDLTPYNVNVKTGRTVWWKCDKGHEWKAKISNRSNGNDCPYCKGRKVCEDNCLSTINPSLAEEWHPTRNGHLKPAQVTASSNKKVWWQCKNGHEWEAVIGSRNSGSGCPKCNISSSYPESFILFCLKQLFPDILHRYKIFDTYEIDIYIPSINLAIEYDGVYWHKKKKKRDLEKNKFLFANDKKLIRVRESGLDFITDFKAFNIPISESPSNKELCSVVAKILSIIKEFDNVKHKNLSLDNINFDIETQVREFMSLQERENSLVEKFPNVAKEWHPTKNGILKPKNFLAQSNIRVWWQCSNGHEWEAAICTRTRNEGLEGTNCPYCYGRYATPENSLATLRPDIAKEWNPNKNGNLTPNEVKLNSEKIVWWICDNKHEWKELVRQRVRRKGCPYCTGRYVTKENCLAKISPETAREWHPSKNGDLTPYDIKSQSNKKVWWLCEKGHSYESPPCERYRGNGCPYCAGKKVDKTNSLKSMNPQLAAQWHPTKNGELTPELVTCGSSKKVWWICEKGHEWMAVIKSRNEGKGCRKCYNLNRKKSNNP